MSSDYITRDVKFGSSVNTATMIPIAELNKSFNYLRDMEVTVKEVTDSAFLIAGSRDQRRIAILQEEPDVKLSADLMSFYPLYYALGSISASATPPHTFEVNSTIPWITIARTLNPIEAGESGLLCVYGAKVDNCEITLENGAVGKVDIDLVGTGATLTTGTVDSTPDHSKHAIYFYDMDIIVDGNTLPEVNVFSVAVNNNLDRRLSVSTASGYRAYSVREGGLEITGKIGVGAKALGMLEDVLNRSTEHTIQAVLNKTHGGTATGTITMPCVFFSEYPEKLSGIEPYEIELAYEAMPPTTGTALTITTSTLLL
jgi:hypothetical protein